MYAWPRRQEELQTERETSAREIEFHLRSVEEQLQMLEEERFSLEGEVAHLKTCLEEKEQRVQMSMRTIEEYETAAAADEKFAQLRSRQLDETREREREEMALKINQLADQLKHLENEVRRLEPH